jgi:hypothetical protein
MARVCYYDNPSPKRACNVVGFECLYVDCRKTDCLMLIWFFSMQVFITAYRQVEPNLYTAMQHLFWTWRDVFPPIPLRAIETKLQFNSKPNGPTTSTQVTRTVDSPSVRPGHGIHVNPKYLEQRQLLQQSRTNRVWFLIPLIYCQFLVGALIYSVTSLIYSII